MSAAITSTTRCEVSPGHTFYSHILLSEWVEPSSGPRSWQLRLGLVVQRTLAPLGCRWWRSPLLLVSGSLSSNKLLWVLLLFRKHELPFFMQEASFLWEVAHYSPEASAGEGDHCIMTLLPFSSESWRAHGHQFGVAEERYPRLASALFPRSSSCLLVLASLSTLNVPPMFALPP